LPRFRAGGAARLKTWVLTIATRVALNELRRAPARTVTVDAAEDRLPAGPPADHALALIVREALELVATGSSRRG
jgi:DNA-directed RNA polymerase specialized sigma24 family protein